MRTGLYSYITFISCISATYCQLITAIHLNYVHIIFALFIEKLHLSVRAGWSVRALDGKCITIIFRHHLASQKR